jgi:hypothetical protein
VALTSYFRSGNSWARHLLQRATGILTGSIYNDLALQRSGLWAEGVIDGTIVVKTHLTNTTLFMFSDLQLMRRGKTPPFPVKYTPAHAAILLIRNPLESVLSWFFYLQTGSHVRTLSEAEIDVDRWEQHVYEEVNYYRRHSEFWLGLADEGRLPVLIVRYEDLRQHTERELRRMLDFLALPDPIDERRLACALELSECHRLPQNCRHGDSNWLRALPYYSNAQRQFVIERLGDLMRRFNYSLDLPLDSPHDYVVPRRNSRNLPVVCRPSSAFDQGVREAARLRDAPFVESEEARLARLQSRPVVLMWSFTNWPGWGMEGEYYNTWGKVRVRKPDLGCDFTRDRNRLEEASLVLFSGVPHSDREGDRWCRVPYEFPPFRRPYQRWATMDYEIPGQFPIVGHPGYRAVFDWHIDYRLDSRWHITMNCPAATNRTFLDPPPPKSRDLLVAYFASRCVAVERDEYVRQLMKHIEVHSYGWCLHNRDLPEENPGAWPRNWDIKIETMGRYKFALAFENDNVTDWITEKLPHAILAGTVPVYMGAPNVDRVAPGNHSFINVADFESPAHLAEYLLYLNEHDEEYYRYFEWKKHGLSPGFKQDMEDCAFFTDAKICRFLLEEQNEERRRAGLPPLDIDLQDPLVNHDDHQGEGHDEKNYENQRQDALLAPDDAEEEDPGSSSEHAAQQQQQQNPHNHPEPKEDPAKVDHTRT